MRVLMITHHTQNGSLQRVAGICVKSILVLGLLVSSTGPTVAYAPTVSHEYKLCQQHIESSLANQSVKAEADVSTSSKVTEKYSNKYDQKLYELCVKYNIEQYEKLVIAISRLETSHYSSEVFCNNNNFGGMFYVDHYMSFNSKDEGAEKFIKMLKFGYIDKGLNSASKMQSKYCPDNVEWSTIVNKLISEIS